MQFYIGDRGFRWQPMVGLVDCGLTGSSPTDEVTQWHLDVGPDRRHQHAVDLGEPGRDVFRQRGGTVRGDAGEAVDAADRRRQLSGNLGEGLDDPERDQSIPLHGDRLGRQLRRLRLSGPTRQDRRGLCSSLPFDRFRREDSIVAFALATVAAAASASILTVYASASATAVTSDASSALRSDAVFCAVTSCWVTIFGRVIASTRGFAPAASAAAVPVSTCSAALCRTTILRNGDRRLRGDRSLLGLPRRASG